MPINWCKDFLNGYSLLMSSLHIKDLTFQTLIAAWESIIKYFCV